MDAQHAQQSATTSDDRYKKWAAVIFAALVLLIYLCLVYRAWNASGDEAEMWARKIYLLGGVESLAFAAAGWFFGREVNRKAVDNLQSQADKARDDAGSAQDKEKQALERLDSARSEAAALAATVKLMARTEIPGQPSAFAEMSHTIDADILRRANQVLDIYGEGRPAE